MTARTSYHRTENYTHSIDHRSAPSRNGRAALKYARRDIPVFPCKPDGKEPLTPRGHLDATTDPQQITAWWDAHPLANIGIPTGKRSGLLVLDVDQPAGLDALEAEHGKLTATRTHSTGSGGMHHLYRYPSDVEVRNSAGKLAPGLDVRGEGGYVIVPPSRTQRPYELLDDVPLAEPPAWLLERLRVTNRPRAGRRGDRPAAVVGLDGPIPEGERNWTLYRLACSMRARGADGAAMLSGLEETNAAHCLPPLDGPELEKIAASAARHAPGKPAPKASTEVLEELDRIQLEAGRVSWRGMGGATDRDVFLMLVKLARRYGTKIPAGVRVSVDMRTLALVSAVGLGSASRAVKRLKIAGRVRTDNLDRRRRESGAFVLVSGAREAEHSGTTERPAGGELDASVPPLAPLTAPRLRWSAPVVESSGGLTLRVGTIRRLGKSAGKVVDALEAAGGTLPLAELYGRLYPDKSPDDKRRWRPRDLLRDSEGYTGPVRRLQKAGVLGFDGANISLSDDWMEALNTERENAGEIAAHRRDMARYERERRAFREHAGRPADPAPTEAEMDKARENRPDGVISELEPVPDDQDQGADAEILAALSEALVRWHDHRDDYPSWWAATLDVDGYLDYRPDPGDVARALELLPQRDAA